MSLNTHAEEARGRLDAVAEKIKRGEQKLELLVNQKPLEVSNRNRDPRAYRRADGSAPPPRIAAMSE